jgi:hypothetical protein
VPSYKQKDIDKWTVFNFAPYMKTVNMPAYLDIAASTFYYSYGSENPEIRDYLSPR